MYKNHDFERLSTEAGSCKSPGIYRSPSDSNISSLQNHPAHFTQVCIPDCPPSPRTYLPISTPIIHRAPSASSYYSKTSHIRESSITPSSEALESLYNRRSESCRDLLEQIQISYQRHLGIRNYLTVLQSQLVSSAEISKAELQTRYDSLKAQATALYNEALNGLERERKDRERRLKEEDQTLSYYIDKLSTAYRFLDLKLKTENKAKFVQNYNQAISEAEEALQIWAPEVLLTNEFTHIPIPQFQYRIRPVNSAENQLDNTRKEGDRFSDLSYRASPIQLIDTSRKEMEKQIELSRVNSPGKAKSTKFINFENLEAKRKEIIERSKPFIDGKGNNKEPHKHKCKYHCQRCKKERDYSSTSITETTIRSIPNDCSKDVWLNDVLKAIPDTSLNKENIPDSKEFIGYQSFGPIKDIPLKCPDTEISTIKSSPRDFSTFTPRLESKPYNLDLISAVLKSSPSIDKTQSYSDRTTLRSPKPVTERQKIDELVEMNQTMADRILKLEEVLGSRGSSLRSSELLSSRELFLQYSSRKQP